MPQFPTIRENRDIDVRVLDFSANVPPPVPGTAIATKPGMTQRYWLQTQIDGRWTRACCYPLTLEQAETLAAEERRHGLRTEIVPEIDES